MEENENIKVINWLLIEMKDGYIYQLNEKQIANINDCFIAFLLPMSPVREYDYYFDFNPEEKTIRKIYFNYKECSKLNSIKIRKDEK